jgi:CheY-like chemotaxis protein
MTQPQRKLTHAPPSSGAYPRGAAPRPFIVVAEDDRDMRRLLAMALTRDGYDLVQASDGDELLHRLAHAREHGLTPALIVSDVRMPCRTGIEVVRAMRSWGWTTPVVLITAFGDEPTLSAAREAGASVVMQKPLALDDLRLVAALLMLSDSDDDGCLACGAALSECAEATMFCEECVDDVAWQPFDDLYVDLGQGH